MMMLMKLTAICAACCVVFYGQAVSQISGNAKDETGVSVPRVDGLKPRLGLGEPRKRTRRVPLVVNLPLGPYRLDATKF